MSLTISIAHAVPTAKVTLRVINENGIPIDGAKVMVGFRPSGATPNVESGFTNDDGLFTASGSTEYSVSSSIKKDGYYPSYKTVEGNYFTSVSGIMGFRRWEPWNPTLTVLLKTIKNPIPLYKRIFGTENTDKQEHRLPKINKFVGFDLVTSDWVTPYGKGTNSDFLFKLEKEIKSVFDYRGTLTLKFSNKGDGIQSFYTPADNTSQFPMSYHAPKDGYKSELVQHYISDPNVTFKSPYRDDQNYFFRVRTEFDDEGKIKSALYGKIERNIKFPFGAIPTGRMKFTYYLNPTLNDTNLEIGNNLFGQKFKKQ